MPSINDWAAKCAAYIIEDLPVHRGVQPREARIAAIIETFAAPLVSLLRESRKSHHRGYNDESCDYPPCPKSDEDAVGDEICTCNADAWNEKIDKVLGGQ